MANYWSVPTISKQSEIDWKNQSYDEFCDILEDVNGREIKRRAVFGFSNWILVFGLQEASFASEQDSKGGRRRCVTREIR